MAPQVFLLKEVVFGAKLSRFFVFKNSPTGLFSQLVFFKDVAKQPDKASSSLLFARTNTF